MDVPELLFEVFTASVILVILFIRRIRRSKRPHLQKKTNIPPPTPPKSSPDTFFPRKSNSDTDFPHTSEDEPHIGDNETFKGDQK